jgi:Ca-activated chloride channel family protein
MASKISSAALGATVALIALAHVRPATAQPIATDRIEAAMVIAGRGADHGTLPIVEERLHVAIDGQHATSTLTQVFHHGNGGQIEGRYRLRPGPGSNVEGFAYWNGEHKIVGEVFERAIAHQVYDNVTSRRRDPGLLEQDGEGAFAFKVFPIEANERKRVELRWTQWLTRHGKAVRFRAPTTRGDATIVVDVVGPTSKLRSSTHRLFVEKTPAGSRLRSEGSRGGELVLEWEVDEPEWQPSAFVHRGSGGGDGWFAVALASGTMGTSAVADKDVTVVIDRSGSMAGEPMAQARLAAADIIRRLAPGDRVNVVSFSDEVDPLFAAPQSVATSRDRAIAFIEKLVEGGGTDIALALATAVRNQARDHERPRVIVFMTDGQSDVERAIAASKSDSGDVRLFTLGLGKDVNRPLLQRLAAEKRGRFTYIERTSDIQREVGLLANHIAKPMLVGVTLEVEGAHAVRLYPRSLPDLFVDDELVVTGRLRSPARHAKFVIKGRLGGKPVALSRTVDLSAAPPRPWVGRLWAQRRVEHLLEDIALAKGGDELVTEVTDLALTYNLITPYTAFLAIPESELGAERGTVEAMRERKRKLLANNPDVASIDKQDRDDVAGVSGAEVDEDHDLASAPPSPAFAEVKRSSRGCAGCATGGGGASALLVLLVAMVLRRARRS